MKRTLVMHIAAQWDFTNQRFAVVDDIAAFVAYILF
jgi:hypothetical protein